MSLAKEHVKEQSRSNNNRLKELTAIIEEKGCLEELQELLFIMNTPCKAYNNRILGIENEYT